jgi:hypothetical protein
MARSRRSSERTAPRAENSSRLSFSPLGAEEDEQPNTDRVEGDGKDSGEGAPQRYQRGWTHLDGRAMTRYFDPYGLTVSTSKTSIPCGPGGLPCAVVRNAPPCKPGQVVGQIECIAIRSDGGRDYCPPKEAEPLTSPMLASRSTKPGD